MQLSSLLPVFSDTSVELTVGGSSPSAEVIA